MTTARPLRILLVNRHLNIGGVETYLYRLCAGLVKRGHSVGLLTEGGLFEDKVAEAGARLHRVPNLAKGWSAALPEIERAGYDLVHGHNYHSARVARALARRLRLPYLMSVHGPRPRLKQLLFRDWSERVVVMSEGDRDNICWWGGVPAGRISLSFYGIDTDRFHPGIETQALRTELGLGAAPTVVFVSRFSNRKADVGHALLDALPRLRADFPDLQLLLVGEGPERPGLDAHIQKLNTTLGTTAARMIGPRRDVERFMALATVAVCTANTALEALACGTPTLAAGRTGFFGLVSETNFEDARALCFADHGHSPRAMGPEPFLETLPALLRDPAAARRAAAQTATLVAERTSVAKMALEMESLYRTLLPPTAA
ncbi:glycosyltransferase family 4 protein [Nibricoccus sp. IMCC34717]|uniref:glycosyltransferase family 4 protein n=1 Tax=Nibricoccus sp. IMCC34717 TaxID=3034021 RepID=UPI00384ECDB1